MLALERRNLILEKLQTEKKVVVSELSQLYEVSEETIRRDLDKLEKEAVSSTKFQKKRSAAILTSSKRKGLLSKAMAVQS